MARNFGPEVKAAMAEKAKDKKQGRKPEPGDTPADMARDKARGIAEDSPQDQRIDARNMPPMPMHGMPPDAHHVNAAASIAHAILGRGGNSGY